MLTIIIFVALLLFMGFVGPELDSTWSNDVFHYPLFIITFILGIIIITVVHVNFFTGYPVILENGEYQLVSMNVGEREGYAIELYNQNKISGTLVSVENDGLIIPIHIQNNIKTEFIEDGKCTVESQNMIKENKLWIIGKGEFCESFKIHLPPGSIIKKYGKSVYE
jgi:hypothetical protein